MSVLNAKDPNREFSEIGVKLHGRFMRENRNEYDCMIASMSPGGVKFRTPVVCEPGERVIAYLDQVGRVEGKVVRNFGDGFEVSLAASQRKREKLAAQLTWLANRTELGLAEDRRHERLAARYGSTTLQTQDGNRYPCTIIDVSFSGIALGLRHKLALETPVIVGTLRGRVVRLFDDGVAVEFATLQNRESIKAAFPANSD